jgi:hypothetical protein
MAPAAVRWGPSLIPQSSKLMLSVPVELCDTAAIAAAVFSSSLSDDSAAAMPLRAVGIGARCSQRPVAGSYASFDAKLPGRSSQPRFSSKSVP